MEKNPAYKSKAFEAIHDIALGMHNAGIITKRTLRNFDNACLTLIQDFTGSDIKALRKREDVSQAVFACYMNVTKDSISKWERNEKKPAGPALKLLSLVKQKGLKAIL